MKYHDSHARWLWKRDGEAVVLFGFMTGRVDYTPEARWLYSFRLFLGPLKVELLWTTGQALTEGT